jgi:hypothetical protein
MVALGNHQSPGQRLPLRRIAAYLVLAVLDAIAMDGDSFTLAIWLFVLPSFFLVAVQWLFLYLPLIDWPLVAWRRTHKAHWVLIWLGLAMVVPVGAPLAFNLVQGAAIGIDRWGDSLPQAATKPAAPLLIAGRCGSECSRLLESGAVSQVYQTLPTFSGKPDRGWIDGSIPYATLKFASTYCDRDRPRHVTALNDRPGWCLVSSTVGRPVFHTVIYFEGFDRPGDKGRRRIEVWTCPSQCTLIARQTEYRERRFHVPLLVDYKNRGERIEPEFRRVAFVKGMSDPAFTLRESLNLAPDVGAPRLGEDPDLQRSLDARAAADKAARKAQEKIVAARSVEDYKRERAADLAKDEHFKEALRRSRRHD